MGAGREKSYTSPTSPLVYLRHEVDLNGDFMEEWKKLDDTTKEWYRAAALAEMEANNIPVQGKK